MNKSVALTQTGGDVAAANILADGSTGLTEVFDRFLRLHTAEADASPATIRTSHSQASQFIAWCREHDINPATATDEDLIA